MQRSETLGKLATAKAQAQQKFLPIGKDLSAKIATKSGRDYGYSYADLAACLDAVMSALSDVGLALFQPSRVRVSPEGQAFAVATTLLIHGESGEWMSEDLEMPIIDPMDARSVGSATTYARRYGLTAMLAIAPRDEDDDAEQARGGQQQQARTAPAPVVTGEYMPKKKEAIGPDSDPPMTDPQKYRITGLYRTLDGLKGKDAGVKVLRELFGTDTRDGLTKAQASVLIDALQQEIEKAEAR